VGRHKRNGAQFPPSFKEFPERNQDMTRQLSWVLCGVLGLGLLAAGCGNAQKDATNAAVEAAQSALNAAQTEAAKYVPDQLHAAQATLQSAKDALAKGDYQGALSAAKDAAGKARDLATAAAAKKDEWTKTWAELNQSLPKSMNLVKNKLEAYAHGARMPTGMDKEKLAEARAQYEQLKQTWADASAAATQGNLGDALKKASAIKEPLAKLMEVLAIKSN
jgi:hypothetical protein